MLLVKPAADTALSTWGLNHDQIQDTSSDGMPILWWKSRYGANAESPSLVPRSLRLLRLWRHHLGPDARE